MNTILLCEGKTDAVLLGYYINKVYDYQHLHYKDYNQHTSIDQLTIKDIDKRNETFEWHHSADNKNYLAIWSVGGCDKLCPALTKLYNLLQKSREDNSFKQIVLICDRDQQENNSTLLEKYHTVSEKINIKFSNQEVIVGTFTDSFQQTRAIRTLTVIIPPNKMGALETTLLDSLKEDNNCSKELVERVDDFIEKIKPVAKKYLSTNRLTLKAKLSTVFAIMSPEKVFDFIDNILTTTIKWEEKNLYLNFLANSKSF